MSYQKLHHFIPLALEALTTACSLGSILVIEPMLQELNALAIEGYKNTSHTKGFIDQLRDTYAEMMLQNEVSDEDPKTDGAQILQTMRSRQMYILSAIGQAMKGEWTGNERVTIAYDISHTTAAFQLVERARQSGMLDISILSTGQIKTSKIALSALRKDLESIGIECPAI